MASPRAGAATGIGAFVLLGLLRRWETRHTVVSAS
jgi:hypothetical protein